MKLSANKITCALALLLGAGNALAAPPGTIATPQVPTQWVGSDTLNQVIDTMLVELKANGTLSNAPDGLLTYNGLGSTAGETQLEGSPTGSQPTCLPTDSNGAPDTNPGCQEMSPMSRPMDSSICEDEEAVGEAEGLAVCVDGLVVITNNAAHQRFADTAAQCPLPNPQTTPNNDTNGDGFPEFANSTTGNIRTSGAVPGTSYTIGAGFTAGNEWKDVLRVIYTGCLGTDGACGASVPRIEPGASPTRGCNGSVRAALVSSWSNIFQGDDCENGACPNGLRQAYRRDDNSGTTGVFLEILGVVGRTLLNRSTVFGLAGLTAIPSSFAFCDGGQLEGFWPDPATAGGQAKGDPLQKTCAAEDDLCGASGVKSATNPTGTLGVVRAIRSPITGGYAVAQCEKGKFAPVAFAGWNTTQAVCPDGTVPKAGTCRLPFWEIGDLNADGDTRDAGERNYNCMNARNNPDTKLGANGVDGRAYNWVMRTETGVVQAVTGSSLPEVAQWRQNTNTINEGLGGNAGGLFPASNRICQEADATRQIGCLVGNTSCTLGFAGREAASTDPYDDLQEPVRLNGLAPNNPNILAATNFYPFKRDLFMNAIGGYEDLTFDCLDRGGSVNYCQDQVDISLEFYNMTAIAQDACIGAGYIPLPESRCDGATGSAGCGAPTVQARTECLPQ